MSEAALPLLQRQLRDFGVGAILAIIVATVAFVAVRNTELAARQIDLATRTATALAGGGAPLPTVQGVLVSPPVPSPKHPYLHQRKIRDDGATWHALVADPVHPAHKLYYDAATRFDATGAVAELMRDGTGRAIAALPACPAGTVATPATPCPIAIGASSFLVNS